MSIIKSIERVMNRYGKTGYVIYPDYEKPVKCFVQPMRYKNKMYLDSQYTKLGIIDETCYMYIGPANVLLSEVAQSALRLEDGNEFNCVKTETIYFGERAAYTWAILRIRR